MNNNCTPLTQNEEDCISSFVMALENSDTNHQHVNIHNSDVVKMILKFLDNIHRISVKSKSKEEDLHIKQLVDPVVWDTFFNTIDMSGVKNHGNGHSLKESTLRKIQEKKRVGLDAKGIRGRIPDRSLEYVKSTLKQHILVCEVKPEGTSKERPDLVKLGSILKDLLDHALAKGVDRGIRLPLVC